MKKPVVAQGETTAFIRHQATTLCFTNRLTEICFARGTVFTNATFRGVKWNDVVTLTQRCYSFPDFNHHTRPFVSEDGREKSFRVISRQGKRIGVTDTRRPDLYQNLSFPGSVYVDCFDTERLTGLVSNCGTTGYHDALLISGSAKYPTQL
jgi:hypothetical protein